MKKAVQRVLGRSGLLSAGLRARSGRPLILMYHGVSAESQFAGLRNASDLHLPRDLFAQHVKLLRRYRRVIGMTEMVTGLREGDDLSNTVALTFDDGYENNVSQAAPILADQNMPAAFFLATAYIGTDRWIWTDQLERAFDTTRVSRLHWHGHELPLETREQRRAALGTVKAELKRMHIDRRDIEMQEVSVLLRLSYAPPSMDYRFMNWQQARQLVDAGFEVGAHTVNHAILSRLPQAQAESEILQSRDAVTAGTGRCCPVFCYPNGKPEDYNEAVIDICQRHFIAALGTGRGTAHPNELFRLARLSTFGDADSLAWLLLREQ